MKQLHALAVAVLLLAGCGRAVDPATAVADARALIAEGRSGEARILLKNALARTTGLPEARVLLATIAFNEGNAKAAEDELSTVDDALLQSPEAVSLRVRVELALDRPEDAATLMAELGDRLPEPERSMLRSRVLLANGSAAEALALLRETQRNAGDSGPLAIEIAGTLAAMGDLTPAIEELTRYLDKEPADRSDALLARGELHLRQGAPEEATEDFRAALAAATEAWPGVSRITTELMLGDALLASGEIEPAKSHIARLEKTWPGMIGTELLGAQVALLEGRPGEAATRMGPIAEANPDNVRLQYLLIDALVQSGNVTRATELLERRIRAEPDDSPARETLAQLYMQQGRPDRVVDLLGDESNTDGADGDDGELLATARAARENASNAIASLNAQLREKPNDVRLRAQLATALTASGDPAAALLTLGPMPLNDWVPESAAARMSALIAMNNEFESNRLVDRLLDPDSAADEAVLIAAADVAYRARQNANVSRLLDRAARLNPGSAEVQLRRASLAFDERRLEDAERMLQQLLKGEPDNIAGAMALGRVASARGDMPRATRILEQAIQKSPDDPEPALLLASLQLRANQPLEARKTLDELIASSDDGWSANAAGMLLVNENRFDEARTRFRQAVDREPGNPQYWFNLGQSQIAIEDRAAASESFMKAASLEPSSLPLAVAAVRLGLSQKNYAAARQSADALARALPGNAVASLLQGQVALAEGRLEQAEKAYSESYRERPSAQAATGEFQARQRRNAPRTDEPLLNWLSREPRDLNVRRLLADHYLVKGQDEPARRQLEALLKYAPNDVAGLNNLAWLLRDSDRKRAESLAQQARAIAPDNPAVADTLGTILLAGGKNAEALEVLKQAAAALPDDASVQGHYKEALRRAEGKL